MSSSAPLAAALSAALALSAPAGGQDMSSGQGPAVPAPAASSSDPLGPWQPTADPSLPAAAPAPEGPAPAPAAPRRRDLGCAGSVPCKRLVILGGVAGGLGVAALIAGAVLMTRPAAVDGDDPTTSITYRPAGAAALAIGTGVLATSLLMFLTAVRAGKAARKSKISNVARRTP